MTTIRRKITMDFRLDKVIEILIVYDWRKCQAIRSRAWRRMRGNLWNDDVFFFSILRVIVVTWSLLPSHCVTQLVRFSARSCRVVFVRWPLNDGVVLRATRYPGSMGDRTESVRSSRRGYSCFSFIKYGWKCWFFMFHSKQDKFLSNVRVSS